MKELQNTSADLLEFSSTEIIFSLFQAFATVKRAHF